MKPKVWLAKLASTGQVRPALFVWLMVGLVSPVLAFCGFYVARADAQLYNKASQIVIARDGLRTKITMVSDYQGAVKDFAMVVPVPTVLKRSEIRVIDPGVVTRLDAYSAPRLVEYFDEDPCQPMLMEEAMPSAAPAESGASNRTRDRALGVTIEAQYSVGEYDIVILSATQSSGLETWLRQNGYKIPAGAKAALAPYIQGGMKFFVAKVNLQNYAQTGYTLLRPLQMSFNSEMFMLPLRLGMLNAAGDQDLIVYALTRGGRVEAANYNTVEVPSNVEIPLYIKEKGEFSRFYTSMFQKAYLRQNQKAAFIEYAWDTSSCDPCASDPPSQSDLLQAGVGWTGSDRVFITRLHVRYNKANFKEDLMFRETRNQQTFQGRYILRHAWKGEATCEAASDYKKELPKRLEAQAQTLANLTDWKIAEIRKRMGIN